MPQEYGPYCARVGRVSTSRMSPPRDHIIKLEAITIDPRSILAMHSIFSPKSRTDKLEELGIPSPGFGWSYFLFPHRAEILVSRSFARFDFCMQALHFGSCILPFWGSIHVGLNASSAVLLCNHLLSGRRGA